MDGLHIVSASPSARLRTWVDNYQLVRMERDVYNKLRFLAMGGSAILLPVEGAPAWESAAARGGLGEGVVLGPRLDWIDIVMPRLSTLLIVNLEPAGLARLLGRRVAETAGALVPLRDLALDRLGRAIEAALGSLLPPRGRPREVPAFELRAASAFATIDQFLDDRIDAVQPPDRRDLGLLMEVYERPGDAKLSRLAERLDVGRERLERSVRSLQGLPPKGFAVLARSRRLYRELAYGAGRRDYAAAALDLGYYDQAHAIHDIVRVTGWTPGHIIRNIELANEGYHNMR